MAFQCVLMQDPVVAADGHTYNREDIENWFKEHSTSPHTNEEFEDKVLRPNIAIRKLLVAWREQHGLPALTFAKPTKAPAHVAGGEGGGRVGGGGGAPIVKPYAVCAHSKKALEAFCITCQKSICSGCAIDAARCKSHDTRPLTWIVSLLRAENDAWVQVLEGRPQQLQAECERVNAAADAAIAEFTSCIREEAAELKLELQRACVGDVEEVVREVGQLLADVELAAAMPEGCDAGSEAARCLLAAATRAARLPPPDSGGGRFEAAAGAAVVNGRRLGRVVGGGAVDAAADAGFGRVEAAASSPASSTCECLWTVLKKDGYTPYELKLAGCSLEMLMALQYDLPSLKFMFSCAAFRAAGIDWATIRTVGFTANEILAAGCNVSDARTVGYDLQSLKNAGVDVAAFRAAGCDWATIRTAGFTARALRLAGCDLPSAISAGCDVPSLLQTFDVVSLIALGCDVSSFILVSCVAAQLHMFTRTLDSNQFPPHTHLPLSATARNCT
jgi:hypothetical protein